MLAAPWVKRSESTTSATPPAIVSRRRVTPVGTSVRTLTARSSTLGPARSWVVANRAGATPAGTVRDTGASCSPRVK